MPDSQKERDRPANLSREKTNCALLLLLRSNDRSPGATKIINRQNESRDYWEERAEQDEYIAELKEAGVIGVDWNIEQCDADGYTDRTATIFFLFTFGKPCFIHSHEGWIKHGYSKKTSLNQSAASHR